MNLCPESRDRFSWLLKYSELRLGKSSFNFHLLSTVRHKNMSYKFIYACINSWFDPFLTIHTHHDEILIHSIIMYAGVPNIYWNKLSMNEWWKQSFLLVFELIVNLLILIIFELNFSWMVYTVVLLSLRLLPYFFCFVIIKIDCHGIDRVCVCVCLCLEKEKAMWNQLVDWYGMVA